MNKNETEEHLYNYYNREIDIYDELYKDETKNKFYVVEMGNMDSSDEGNFDRYIYCIIEDIFADSQAFNERMQKVKINNSESELKKILIFSDYEEYIEKISSSTKKVLKLTELNKCDKIFTQPKKQNIQLQSAFNYLEYSSLIKSKDFSLQISGNTFPIKILDLVSMYNGVGDILFNKNIRFGKKNTKISDKFSKIISERIYHKVKENYYPNLEDLTEDDRVIFDKLCSVLDISNIVIDSKKELFIFNHNGVTIVNYSPESNIKYFYDNKITIDKLDMVSVVNGAQTIYTLSRKYYKLKVELETIYNGVQEEKCGKPIDFIKILNEVYTEFEIKTTFINHNIHELVEDNNCGRDLKEELFKTYNEYIDYITVGLNNQLETKVQDTLLVEWRDLSELLGNEIELVKDGQVRNSKSIMIIDVIKLYLTYEGEPGKAKNIRKEKYKVECENLIQKLKDELYLEKFKKFINIYINLNFKGILKNLKNENFRFFRFAKLYFLAYFKEELIFLFDDGVNESFQEVLLEYSIEFCDELLKNYDESIDKKVRGLDNASNFKKDLLYNHIVDKKEKSNNEISDLYAQCRQICQIFNTQSKAVNNDKSYRSREIKKIALDNGFDLFNQINIRTVKVKKNNCKEAISFGNNTFTEIVNFYMNENKKCKNLIFSNSTLSNELEKKYIFFYENDENRELWFTKEFKFSDSKCLLQQAEEIFDDTNKKIEEGRRDFITISDKRSFHIRTHAKDSLDTIDYTDGDTITKRAFWINSNILYETIINNKFDTLTSDKTHK